jgi:hypothetical protein
MHPFLVHVQALGFLAGAMDIGSSPGWCSMRLISAIMHGRKVQYPAVFGGASRVRVQLRPMAFGQNGKWACAQCWTGP